MFLKNHGYCASPELKFPCACAWIMRRTRSTGKCLFHLLAEEFIHILQAMYVTCLFRMEDSGKKRFCKVYKSNMPEYGEISSCSRKAVRVLYMAVLYLEEGCGGSLYFSSSRSYTGSLLQASVDPCHVERARGVW